MSPVRFELNDAWFLWCLPRTGCDLESLLHVYTFVARDAVPAYDRVAGCLSRAIRAGLMPVPMDGRYQLTPGWYDWLHRMDEVYQAPEYGLSEVEEEFVARDWPVVVDDAFVLPLPEYERGADRVRQHLASVFGRK